MKDMIFYNYCQKKCPRELVYFSYKFKSYSKWFCFSILQLKESLKGGLDYTIPNLIIIRGNIFVI